METFAASKKRKESTNDEEPSGSNKRPKTRSNGTDTLSYLREKSERDSTLRKEELELRKTELEIQRTMLQQQRLEQQNNQQQNQQMIFMMAQFLQNQQNQTN